MRQLVRRLAAYVPATINRQILNGTLPQPGEGTWLKAATLFADLSGFTSMAEALAADGPRGAEELNRKLLMTFTPLINAIHDAGGAVSHFHGDAMMVYFLDDDGRAASRALACARFMQSLMSTTLAQVTTMREGEQALTFRLTMKIGVGYGRCLQVIVGDPSASLEFVLAGTAVDEAVAAQNRAVSGQVVASRAALEQAGLAADNHFRPVSEVPPVPSTQPLFYWETFDQPALTNLLALAPAFVPRTLAERLQNPDTQFVAEHRPVTTLFVRFEGIDYSASDAGSKLQAYYQWATEVVSKFGNKNGRVNRILTGDKGSQLHIIFGAPVAPDAPIQAVRCALALHAEKPPFIRQQQIGLSAGRVFACAVGSQNRREYTTVGSVVNLSSRLTSQAAAGEILVDEVTALRVQDEIELAQLPAVTLKGKSRPVTIYRIVAERTQPRTRSAPGRLQPEMKPPFGRDEELAQLLSYVDAALQGKGSVVALFGPFGSGQTPLLAEAGRRWWASDGRLLTSVCQAHLADVPFAPWQTIWHDFFQLSADMDEAARMQAVRVQAADLCPDCGDDADLWGDLLGLPMVTEGPPAQLSVEARQARLFALIRRTLLAAAARQPLMLVLEDVHLADQLSLDLIDELAQVIDAVPVLLALTYRTSADFRLRTLNRPNCRAIPLEDLSPEKARLLLFERLGTEEVPMIVEQRLGLRDRQGQPSPVNPLFLEESLKMMLESGHLRVEPGSDGRQRIRVQETGLLQMQVPDTIYNVLLARLDQLSAARRSLVQVAAVIGREFDLATLVAVTPGMSQQQVVSHLQALIQSDMVQQIAYEPEPAYIFQHALTHDVVYQSLPYARRRALHAAIGDLIAARHRENLRPFYPVLAYHYAQTDRHEEGLQYALAAADDAAAIFANQGAADLYKLAATHVEALGVAEYWQTAVHIHASWARVLRLMGAFTKATLAATEALKLCLIYGGIEQTLPIYNQLAEIRYHQARYDDVEALANKVINNLGDYTPPGELAQAYLLSGMAAAALVWREKALDRLERAEEICVATEDRRRLVPVWGAMAGVYVEQHRWRQAVETAVRAAELAQANDLPTQEALARYRLSRVQLQAGLPQEAAQNANIALAMVRSASHNLRAHILTHRAAVSIYQGHFDAALSDLRMAVDLFATMDDAVGLLQAYLLWGFEYSRGIDDWQEARRRLVQVGQLVASQEESSMYVQEAARLWLGLGIVAFHLKHLSQAKDLFEKAMRVIEARRLRWWRPMVLYWLARVEIAHGAAPDEGAALLRQAIQAIHAGGSPDELAIILLELAQLRQGDERWELLEACVAAAQQRARYTDRRYCFRVAGELLLEAESPRLRRLGGSCLAWLES